MKMLKNLRNRLRKNVTGNERGQGATEYILLLVVVVSLVILFKDKIKATVTNKVGALDTDINSVTSQ